MDSIISIDTKYKENTIYDIEKKDYNVSLKTSEIDERWAKKGEVLVSTKDTGNNVKVKFSSNKKIVLDYDELHDLYVVLNEIYKEKVKIKHISY